jgi:hypothetical protein
MARNTLAGYVSRQHRLRRGFRILTLLFSGSGLAGWVFWEPIAGIALILISLVQLVALVENQLIRSDKEIEEICTLRSLYTKYFNRLEWLE